MNPIKQLYIEQHKQQWLELVQKNEDVQPVSFNELFEVFVNNNLSWYKFRVELIKTHILKMFPKEFKKVKFHDEISFYDGENKFFFEVLIPISGGIHCLYDEFGRFIEKY